MTTKEAADIALSCGAKRASAVAQGDIVLSDTFFDLCKANACGNYGMCHMCPPDIGDIKALMNAVRACSWGVLYQTVGALEDSFDIEGMQDAARAHARVSLRIKRALPGALHLTCGGCRLCDVCAKREHQPCRFPQDAMPSLEGYGVDVYQTAKNAHLPYINGQNTVTYFGMVLFS